MAGVPSPCVNICMIDEDTGWCAGCFRTLDEVALWGSLSDEGKREVLARLPERRAFVAGGTVRVDDR